MTEAPTKNGIKGGFAYSRSDKDAAFPAGNAVAPADRIATAYPLLSVPEDQDRRPHSRPAALRDKGQRLFE